MKAVENIPAQEESDILKVKKSKIGHRQINWEKASQIATVCNSFCVVVAMISLLVSIYPQIIRSNDNYIEKANAGDVYSQMFLADHYYEIGDYSESIYWYKIASTAEKSDYRYYAYNNLGYLYASGYGFSDDFNDIFCRYEKALRLFEKADSYRKISNDNICLLLETNSREDFPHVSNEEYDELLSRYGINNAVQTVSYEFLDISRGFSFRQGNKKYEGGSYVATEDDKGMIVGKFIYRVYTYNDESVIGGKYNYIDFRHIDLA